MSLRAVSLISCCVLALLFAGRGYIDVLSRPRPAFDAEVRAPYHAQRAVQLSLSSVWPQGGGDRLPDLGKRKGIVFSPDLSEPGNREFYQALGFAYFEDPSWLAVIDQIRVHNQSHWEEPVEVLLIQSHGTNGDALKLQTGKEPEALRSYISLGALQERLAETDVHVCLIAACNAGRLSRPENYLTVNPEPGNRLFEPATLGIVNATSDFDPSRSSVVIGRRAESHIEIVNQWRISELSPSIRAALTQGPESSGLSSNARIAIPEMLIQLLLKDERLHLLSAGYVIQKSRLETDDGEREELISRFLRFLNTVPVIPRASSPAQRRLADTASQGTK